VERGVKKFEKMRRMFSGIKEHPQIGRRGKCGWKEPNMRRIVGYINP